MRSRLLIGGLCAAVALLAVTTPASAQSTVERDSGKLKKGQTRFWNIPTDTSMILRVEVVTFKDVDADITITKGEGDDKETVVSSLSGTIGYEIAAVGLEGATTYTIAVTSVSGPTSQFTILFSTVAEPGVSGGPARIAAGGAFMLEEPVSDPEVAALQKLVLERVAAKRR